MIRLKCRDVSEKMKILNGDKKEVGKGEQCFYCGSTNTITYKHSNGVMFEIQCNACHENSIY